MVQVHEEVAARDVPVRHRYQIGHQASNLCTRSAVFRCETRKRFLKVLHVSDLPGTAWGINASLCSTWLLLSFTSRMWCQLCGCASRTPHSHGQRLDARHWVILVQDGPINPQVHHFLGHTFEIGNALSRLSCASACGAQYWVARVYIRMVQVHHVQ